MRSADDSLQINSSADFVFELTRDKINLHPNYNPQGPLRHTNTIDDLEYSADEIYNASILSDLRRDAEFNQHTVIPNVNAPVTVQREDCKKRERKAIFEKYKQKN